MIKYFVAFYDSDKSYAYHADTNKFVPYSTVYRHLYTDIEQARAAARYAKHHNKNKRMNIFVDSMIVKGENHV